MLALLVKGSTEKVLVSGDIDAPVKEYPPTQDPASNAANITIIYIRFKAATTRQSIFLRCRCQV